MHGGGEKVAKKQKNICSSLGSCCKVDSLVGVDDRGQMVLPKSIREKMKIAAGDKLAVVTWEKDGEVCCISMIKADELADMTKSMLGPLMKELF